MKILIDGRLYGLENAGLGRYVINLIRELSKTDPGNEYVLLLRKKYFNLLELPGNWKKVLADYRHYSFAEQFKLPGIIKREHPDLVHFPHFNVPIFYGGKYVVTIHDLLMHTQKGLDATTLPVFMYTIKRVAYRFVFNTAIKRSLAIIVPSNSVKNDLTKTYGIFGHKIFVTYEGVDIKKGSDQVAIPKGQYFIYTGNAYPHKNLEKLVKAIVLLNKKHTQPVKLLISSSRGIFTQRLERIINDQKASSFVYLLGFTPDEALVTLYRNSAAFIFPSLSEGFGLPGLEAMSAGTVVLASDIPVFKEIYKDNAKYFDPKNTESVARAMEEVLNIDKDSRTKIIEKGKDFVKRYSWSKMAQETLKIYESCNSVRQSK